MKISEQEKEWRAEDDAHILMEYQKIYKDRQRIKAAKEKLKERKAEIEKALE